MSNRKQYMYKVIDRDGHTILVTGDFVKAYDMMVNNPVEQYQILTIDNKPVMQLN